MDNKLLYVSPVSRYLTITYLIRSAILRRTASPQRFRKKLCISGTSGQDFHSDNFFGANVINMRLFTLGGKR